MPVLSERNAVFLNSTNLLYRKNVYDVEPMTSLTCAFAARVSLAM